MSQIIAAYSGSFDPITLGHDDIMYRAARQGCTPMLRARALREGIGSMDDVVCFLENHS